MAESRRPEPPFGAVHTGDAAYWANEGTSTLDAGELQVTLDFTDDNGAAVGTVTFEVMRRRWEILSQSTSASVTAAAAWYVDSAQLLGPLDLPQLDGLRAA